MIKRRYISLGSTCGVAYQLQKLGLKKETLPFDWVKSSNLQAVWKCMYNGFNIFGHGLKYCRESTKHSILKTEEWSDIATSTSYIYQNSSGIMFFHDFNTIYKDETDPIYLLFKEKYTRRLDRLESLFITGDHLIFIRDEHRPKSLHLDILIAFVEWLVSKLKNGTTMEFILIINNPNKFNFDFESKLNNYRIILINDTEKMMDWQRNNLDWQRILQI